MNVIAFNLFGIDVYWYGVIVTFAFLVGLILLWKNRGKYGISFDDCLDVFIITFPISIIGARIYFVLFKLDYYLQYPGEILNFRGGGLAIYGGIIAGTISIYFVTKFKKIKFLDMLDYVVPALAIGQCIGRWGNFANNEAYGIETNLPWAIKVMENGVYKSVHPTFLYESISTFIIFIILTKISKRRSFTGEITYIYIILYSFIRFFIEGIRTDSLMLNNIRISQILSLILLVTFLGILSKEVVKKIKGR